MTRTIDIRNTCAISKLAAVAAVFLCGAAGLLIVGLVPEVEVVAIDEGVPQAIGGVQSGEMPEISDLDCWCIFVPRSTTSNRDL